MGGTMLWYLRNYDSPISQNLKFLGGAATQAKN